MSGTMLIALHKPYDVLSQFTQEAPGQRTLAECSLPPRVYPVGRLDADSEGLLLLTDEPGLNTHPPASHARALAAVLGAGRGIAFGAVARGAFARRARAGKNDAARARLAAGSSAGCAAARSADSRAQGDSRHVDRARAARGAQSPGAAHDGRPSDTRHCGCCVCESARSICRRI